MKYCLGFFFLIVLINLSTASAQQNNGTVLSVGLPEQSNFSADRLARIDKIVQQYIDSGWINGAIALVAKMEKLFITRALDMMIKN